MNSLAYKGHEEEAKSMKKEQCGIARRLAGLVVGLG